MLKSPPSVLERFLFSPRLRIYNLRVLFLVTITLIGATVISTPRPGSALQSGTASVYNEESALVIRLVSCIFILLHHILRLFRKRLNAACDCCLNLLEICAAAYLAGFSYYIWRYVSPGFNVTLIAHPIQLITLILSLIWSTATLMTTPQKIMLQRFDFLGGCKKSESYTIARILVNRSVRGEYPAIAIVRGLALTALCFLFPVIALYNVIVSPLEAKVFIRQIQPVIGGPELQVEPFLDRELLLVVWGHSGMVLVDARICESVDKQQLMISGNALHPNGVAVPSEGGPEFWRCGFILDANFNFNFSAVDSTIYVQIGQGHENQTDNIDDLVQYTDPIALFPGGRLAATLTWTQYQVISPGLPSLMGSFAPLRTFLIAELHSIQPDSLYNNVSNVSYTDSTLTVVQTRPDPVKFIQEYTESSALDGFATVGGLWTFVNGAFVLFFGANVLYFLFGTRPLSALGIVHIFQRRRLVQQWHEDFPALRTEGGRPGSERAGIVAFLRERLVDLESDEEADERDLEAQNQFTHTGCDELGNTGRSKDELVENQMADNMSVHGIINGNDIWIRSQHISDDGYRSDEISLIDRDTMSEKGRN
ncbi:Short-chain dehydrogenase/reductase family protein [Mycena venus]|uniref:Short-chain dehydrogenase/reductase family protein n=1 Tax=Mycena venus TaxID=2733690 RepID=A0A8H7CZ33_9AGAR|nr:Short-chain dehydrogenase/reductase family protein [Mycena venus]